MQKEAACEHFTSVNISSVEAGKILLKHYKINKKKQDTR